MPKWNPVKSLARGKPDDKPGLSASTKGQKPHVPNKKAKNILTDGSQLPSNNPY